MVFKILLLPPVDLNIIGLKFFITFSSLKQYFFFYGRPCNGLAWHRFPDIPHIKFKNGRKSAILKLIVEFFKGISRLKQHILFYGNVLAIWHSFQGIPHIKVINDPNFDPFHKELIQLTVKIWEI